MTDRAIRYVRHHVLSGFGTTGQRALDDAHALVIGLGGLGCPVVQYLTGSGVGRLTINDFDRVDESNLARQLLYQPDDLGRPKAAAITDWIEQNNGDVSVEAIARRLDPTELEDQIVPCGRQRYPHRYRQYLYSPNLPLLGIGYRRHRLQLGHQGS